MIDKIRYYITFPLMVIWIFVFSGLIFIGGPLTWKHFVLAVLAAVREERDSYTDKLTK